MGQRHLSSVYKALATEANGKYDVVREVRYDEDKKHDQRFTLLKQVKGKVVEVAHMTIRSLPGCCGVALFHSFKGDTKEVIQFIKYGLAAVKRAKYGQLMLTLRNDSAIIPAIATDAHSFMVDFMNGKTGNKITTVLIDLLQEAKKAKDTEGE